MIHGLISVDNPTQHEVVMYIGESVKRTAYIPVYPGDPVTSKMIIQLCDMHSAFIDLLIIGNLAMTLLAFPCFLQFDEFHFLHSYDVVILNEHIALKLRKS